MAILALCLVGCGRKAATHTASSQTALETSSQSAQEVHFSADSAYQYVAHQVAFGARVPATSAHKACADWLTEKLAQHGAAVEIQRGTMTNYAGEAQPIMNIIGKFRPEAEKRILLCAHWDSRPWADQEDASQPVMGANDGASGVGVLLEIARQLGLSAKADSTKASEKKTEYGVDIVLFDAEDMGTPEWYEGPQREDTWCLGSQLWSKKTIASPSKGKEYAFGILLDMVGTPGAVFPKEYFSMQYGSRYVEQIWQAANKMGYGRFFINSQSYPLTDDHYYVNTIAHIPCVDIIHYDQRNGNGFPPYWHTTHDDMSNVSRETLEAVGKTVMMVIVEG